MRYDDEYDWTQSDHQPISKVVTTIGVCLMFIAIVVVAIVVVG